MTNSLPKLTIVLSMALWSWLVGIAAIDTSNHSYAAANSPIPKLVFAHYMVCCPYTGHTASVDDFKKEILDAQRHKIDGFVLNIGEWVHETIYQVLSRKMFEAAKQLDSGFKLVFSFDNLPADVAAVVLSEFDQHPNYFRINDRPVISTYSGSPAWGTDLAARLKQRGVEPFFVPNYQYLSEAPWARNHNMPTASFLDELYRENPDLQGYFFFGIDIGYKSPITIIPIVAERSRAAGKVSMVGIMPFYRGLWTNYRVFESGGFQGMQAQWSAAIRSNADWVEIVTWNDWGEDTYVAPFGAPREQNIWNDHWGPMLSHVGFLDASAYFIDWFKTGMAPKIDRDRIFYFYRLHSKYVAGIVAPDTGEAGQPRGWRDLEDRFYITSFLTRPLTLDATVGGRRTSITLSAGVTNRDLNIDEGTIELAVRDQSRLLGEKQLEFPVTNSGKIGNFNYFSGEIALP
jgi:glucan endo-1,3-alpha-glucosidase